MQGLTGTSKLIGLAGAVLLVALVASGCSSGNPTPEQNAINAANQADQAAGRADAAAQRAQAAASQAQSAASRTEQAANDAKAAADRAEAIAEKTMSRAPRGRRGGMRYHRRHRHHAAAEAAPAAAAPEAAPPPAPEAPQAAALRLRLAAPLNRYVVLIRFEGLNNKGSSKRAALVLFGGKRQTDCLRRAWLVSMR